MKFHYLLLFVVASIAVSCTSGAKVDPIPQKTALQAFSDSVKLDTFKVALTGKESKNMSFVITITNYKGVQIFKEAIPATTLLKSYIASQDLKKENDKIKFLNDEVNFVFNEEHFLIPAVTDEEKPDKNVPDVAFYEELRKTKLNGFSYSLGKDTQIYIAWSEKDQKVKVYYKCC